MKPVYTFLMVLLLAGLGAYVYFFESQPVDPNAGASSKPKVQLLSLEKNKLQKLELDQNSPAQSVVLENKGGKWLFAGKPADSSRIDTLLTELENWQAADTLEPSLAPAHAADFGLEPPDLILRLSLSGGRQEVFKIGSKTPTSSGYYLLKQGDPALYLTYVNVPEDLRRLITQPPLPTPAPAAAVSPAGSPAAH